MIAEHDPVIIRGNLLWLQACVPASWTDLEVEEFAEDEHPAGTSAGWRVRAEAGRVPCSDREGFCHVVVGV